MLNFFFYLSVFSLSLGQFARVATVGGSKVYFFDLVIGLFAVFGTFYYLVSGRKFRISKNLMLFFVFGGIAAVSLIPGFYVHSVDNTVVAMFYLVRFLSYLLVGNLVYNLVLDKKLKTEAILRTFLYSGLFLAVAGFVQLKVLPDFTVLDPALGWDPHKNRLASTFFDPNFMGGYFVLLLTLLLFKKKEYVELLKSRRNYFIAFGVLLLGLFLTYSRSSWGMFGVVILLFGLVRSRWLVLLALVIAFLTYFAVPRIQTRLAGITDPADSAYFRVISWQNTFRIAHDNLFLGVGYNYFKPSQVEYGFLTPDTVSEHNSAGSDSSVLLVLATTGILGALIFILGWFYPALANKSLFLFTVVAALFLHSQFVNSLFYPQIMFTWLVLISAVSDTIG